MIKKLLPFFLIFALGLFFRLWRFEALYAYGHEQDLQGFIIKDIVIDHHPRLIGQETSIMGFFIGPLYYYFLALFFLIFGMHPLSAVIPITMISMITLTSVYFVFSKLFSVRLGLIAAFLYALSPNIIFLDRWIVPTQPTLLWSVWFLFVIFSIARNKFYVLPILVILLGLIWHVHIAFVSLLILVPVAFIFSGRSFFRMKKDVNEKWLGISLFGFVVLTLPFVFFELRHGFGQIKALTVATQSGEEIRTGAYKLAIILMNVDRVLKGSFFHGPVGSLGHIWVIPVTLILFFAGLFYLKKKIVISKAEFVLLALWVGITIFVHFVSKRTITEYYFNNLYVVGIAFFSLFLGKILPYKQTGAICILLGIIYFLSTARYISRLPDAQGEYAYRMRVVEYIEQNVREKNYPCVGINFIGGMELPYGWRYLFWYKKVRLVTPGNDVPVFSIVRPFTISESEIAAKFGDLGVILPRNPGGGVDCSSASRQLLPLNGFVN